MALRAKKPEVKESRLKVLMYANTGAGKTHFCVSLPDTYYIDTENVTDYPHLCQMLVDNGGDLIHLNEMEEIISQVQDLLTTEHNYKTLVIDSISFPYAWLTQNEAERLNKKSPNTEGTEFGANLAKAKRLVFKLGILLSRLDMNVIVVSHERTKYAANVEIGKTYDINEKLAYSLGTVWNLRLQGDSRKLFIEKSRYAQLKTNSLIDFDNGYETIKQLFGESIFLRKVKTETFANSSQINELKRLCHILNIPEENINKMLTVGKATCMEELTESYAQKAIDKLLTKLTGEAA